MRGAEFSNRQTFCEAVAAVARCFASTKGTALDSIWAYDVRGDVPNGRRFVALGRDTDSEFDAALLDASTVGFQNEGDNEPAGLFASDGAVESRG